MVESGSLLRSYGVKPIEGSNPSLSVIEPVGSLYQFSGNLVSELPQLSYAIVGASKPKPRSPTTALRAVLFAMRGFPLHRDALSIANNSEAYLPSIGSSPSS